MGSPGVISIATVAGILALGCVGAVLSPIVREAYEVPNVRQMRAYRMSLFSDAQLMEMHTRAVADAAKQKQWAEEQDKAFGKIAAVQ